MSSDALTTRLPGRPLRSKRLLALAGDERIVEQIRRGNELAFEVAFERHGGGILAFCRHMLGSPEEAEDAVQHTFAAAFRDLARDGERAIALKPWLYTIARNRCLSLLRARRETAELQELPTEGLSDEVERREELRDLLADVRELPEDQRAALLLAEAAGMSHAEVAQVLGCEAGSVKGLVFRARSSLIERREARHMPCSEIREQLATLRGGALRRNDLRHHLRHCAGCAAYRDEVRRQRQMLAVALPIVPSLGLKSKVLAAAGIAGGGAGGGAAAGGLVGGAALASFGSGTVAKVAVVGALATGGVVGGSAVVDRPAEQRAPVPAAAQDAPAARGENGEHGQAGGEGHGERMSTERSHGPRDVERRAEPSRGRGPNSIADTDRGRARSVAPAADGRRLGEAERAEKVQGAPAKPEPRTKERAAPRPQREVTREVTVLPRPKATAPQSAPVAPEPVPVPEVPSIEQVTPE
jgi:RNA polymerase sigma factor (sigma-70 family)